MENQNLKKMNTTELIDYKVEVKTESAEALETKHFTFPQQESIVDCLSNIKEIITKEVETASAAVKIDITVIKA